MTAENVNSGVAPPLLVAAMVSGPGRGSNLGALIEGSTSGGCGCRIALVIGTRADALALDRARAAGVAVTVISPRKYEDDDAAYGQALLRTLNRHGIGLICLAGYMRKLPPSLVSHFHGRIMNIHPALLPFFGGQGMYGEHVHQAVLDSGMKVSGCTVHFVDEHYDTGPIILQATVPVEEDDTSATLGQRVLRAEHATYFRAVQLFAEGRLTIQGSRVRVLPTKDIGDAL